MNKLAQLLKMIFLGLLIAPTFLSANCEDNPDKCFHVTPNENPSDDVIREQRPSVYFQAYRPFMFEQEGNDPTYELDAETAWPGEREDFSDDLFR